MPTVIDSLIVTLGLNKGSFDKDTKDAAAALKQTGEGAERVGKQIEAGAQKSVNYISQLRGQFLLLFAAVAGGKGISAFTQDLVKSGAALGRMASLIGSSVQEISKWQGLVTGTGGNAAGAAAGIDSLNQSIENFVLTGESSMIPYLRALQTFAPGVDLSLTKANGEAKRAPELLNNLNQAVQGLDKAKAHALLTGLGLSQDLQMVVLQTRQDFIRQQEDIKRWGLTTDGQTQAATRLQYGWAGVTRSFEQMGYVILEKVEPFVTKLLTELTDLFVWFQKNPGEMEKAVYAIALAFGVLAAVIMGPIGLLATLTGAVALLYTDWAKYNATGESQFKDFWQYVENGWKSILDTAKTTWNQINEYARPVLDYLQTAWSDFVAKSIAAFHLFVALFFGSADQIKAAWAEVIGSFGKEWNDTWNAISNAIEYAGPKILAATKKAFGVAFDWAIERANAIWTAITGHNLIDANGDRVSPEAAARAAGAGAGGVTGGGGIGGAFAQLNPTKPADPKQTEEDVQYFMTKGWTREQASGIVANIVTESQGNKDAIGDGGLAYGIGQWHPDRQIKFGQLFGHDIRNGTREEQLQFYDWELHNSERQAGFNLAMARSAAKAGSVVSKDFERPKNVEGEAEARAKLATEIFKGPSQATSAVRTASQPAPPASISYGSATAADARNANNDNSKTVHVETNVQEMNINTQASDPEGIGEGVAGALSSHTQAALSNTGQI